MFNVETPSIMYVLLNVLKVYILNGINFKCMKQNNTLVIIVWENSK